MPQSDTDDLLPKYFTDAAAPRDRFAADIIKEKLRKRILIIHGAGGIGKSTLLRMFRLYCKGEKIPVALVSGDEAKSALAILEKWADDLKEDGVPLERFAETLRQYRECRTIPAREEDQINKTLQEDADRQYLTGLREFLVKHFNVEDLRDLCFDLGCDFESLGGEGRSGKARELVKYCECRGQTRELGDRARALRPDVPCSENQAVSQKTLANVLDSKDGPAYADWLRGLGLTQPAIDLLRDPAKRLTDDFLVDIEQVGPKHLVLMLDVFEQLSVLEDWVRDLARGLNSHVLLVIAGQMKPDWKSVWSGWQALARFEKLKPMSPDEMRELAEKYYLFMNNDGETDPGQPDPKQVEAIVSFARGYPLAVTTAVDLWRENGVEDFEVIRGEVVAGLANRLKEGISKEMTPALEAATIVHWFNPEILRAVTGRADENEAFDELRRFSCVSPCVEGWKLHDAVRMFLDRDLRTRYSERRRQLHERAAGYFERERLELEQLYHHICADEEDGIKKFQEKAEELTQNRRVHDLGELLGALGELVGEVDTSPLRLENSRLWLKYYGARLAHLEKRRSDAENGYRQIGNNESAEPKLRAYALCDLGTLIVEDYDCLGQRGAEANEYLRESLNMEPSVPLDSHLSESLFKLARVARYQGMWAEETGYLEEAKRFFEGSGDNYGLAVTYSEMMRASARRGLWNQFITSRQQARDTMSQILTPHSSLKARVLGDWGWSLALAGRPSECVMGAKEALASSRKLRDDEAILHALRDLGVGLGMQDRFTEADKHFQEACHIAERLKGTLSVENGSILGFRGLVLGRSGDFTRAQDDLIRSLDIKESLREMPGVQEPLIWLGINLELQGKWDEAANYYQRNAERKQYGRYYFDNCALVGLIRIKYAQGDYAAIPSLLEDAERLAQDYEYNDHLTSLRLIKGHVAWDGHIPEWGKGRDAALPYYRDALIYALRYNRFLLDETLSGRPRPQGTPLRPIIPHCLRRDEDGRRMLEELRQWWEKDNIGPPHTDTISLITKDTPLRKAESDARGFEPGDGSPQRPVLEQIDEALSR